MYIAGVGNSLCDIHSSTASSITFQASTSNSTQAIAILPKRISTRHLDHVIAFQLGLSKRSLVKRSSPNNSISSVFARNPGYERYSVDWENVFGSSAQTASSPDVSLSTAFNESFSLNSSPRGEPEMWSSRFMGRASMGTLLNITSGNSSSLNMDSLKRTMSLPNLRRQTLDHQLLCYSSNVAGSNESRGIEKSSAGSQELSDAIQCSEDRKGSERGDEEDDDKVDSDVQELMRTYDVVSSLEARAPPGYLDSKGFSSMLKRLRRMPALAKRILVLTRRKSQRA